MHVHEQYIILTRIYTLNTRLFSFFFILPVLAPEVECSRMLGRSSGVSVFLFKVKDSNIPLTSQESLYVCVGACTCVDAPLFDGQPR